LLVDHRWSGTLTRFMAVPFDKGRKTGSGIREKKRIAMSDANHLRKWAAQVARQAGEEPDDAEARRLLSIAEYWVQLADGEESNQLSADLG
jgi:hypothetical protein